MTSKGWVTELTNRNRLSNLSRTDQPLLFILLKFIPIPFEGSNLQSRILLSAAGLS